MFPIGFSWTRLSSSTNINTAIKYASNYTASKSSIIMTRSSPTPQGRSQLGHEIVKAEIVKAELQALYKLTDDDIVEAI